MVTNAARTVSRDWSGVKLLRLHPAIGRWIFREAFVAWLGR